MVLRGERNFEKNSSVSFGYGENTNMIGEILKIEEVTMHLQKVIWKILVCSQI